MGVEPDELKGNNFDVAVKLMSWILNEQSLDQPTKIRFQDAIVMLVASTREYCYADQKKAKKGIKELLARCKLQEKAFSSWDSKLNNALHQVFVRPEQAKKDTSMMCCMARLW